MNATLDAPGTRCAFESHGCTALVSGRGGFDQHHPVPIELGGNPNQQLLALCPIHHRRQHALIRTYVETDGQPPAALLRHYTKPERDTAWDAYQAWVANGSPAIHGWPCPAAHV